MSQEAVNTLHRYFIWANRMRIHFDEVLSKRSSTPQKEFQIDSRLYMSYWYAGLYVVIEGWKELRLHDTTIDQLLASQNVAHLKRYRHGVFHFQKKYNDSRFQEFIEQGEKPVQWVRLLTSEFSRWFLWTLRGAKSTQPIAPADQATRRPGG